MLSTSHRGSTRKVPVAPLVLVLRRGALRRATSSFTATCSFTATRDLAVKLCRFHTVVCCVVDFTPWLHSKGGSASRFLVEPRCERLLRTRKAKVGFARFRSCVVDLLDRLQRTQRSRTPSIESRDCWNAVLAHQLYPVEIDQRPIRTNHPNHPSLA